ncbi:MAG TPA: AAA family ATPase, partial [Candidatus Desulfofervidus auxilii]|nr:AAA family ATPase [Candidatus Desulfofervidus auxilii]
MKLSIFFKNYQPLTTNQNNYPLIYADYVALDLKSQWFVNDMGCNRWKDRSINARIEAKFPQIKTIEEFDFFFQPSIPEAFIKELAELSFIGKAENVLFLGPPGVGKTHLSIA